MSIQLEFIGDEAGYTMNKQIQFCIENNLDSIHLRSIEGKLLHEFAVSEREKYAEELRERGIVVKCILSKIGKSPVRDPAKWIEDIREYVSICKEFKCRYLRVFSYGFENEEAARAVQYLAHDNGVVIAIENEIGTSMNSLQQASILLENYDYSFTILLDIGNLFIENKDAVEFYEKLKSYISLVHVKELSIDEFGNYVGCKLGKGCTNTREMMKILDKSFDGNVVLEAYHKIQDNKAELKYETMKEIYKSFFEYS